MEHGRSAATTNLAALDDYGLLKQRSRSNVRWVRVQTAGQTKSRPPNRTIN